MMKAISAIVVLALSCSSSLPETETVAELSVAAFPCTCPSGVPAFNLTTLLVGTELPINWDTLNVLPLGARCIRGQTMEWVRNCEFNGQILHGPGKACRHTWVTRVGNLRTIAPAYVIVTDEGFNGWRYRYPCSEPPPRASIFSDGFENSTTNKWNEVFPPWQ